VGRAKRGDRELALPELLGAGEVAQLLHPVGVEDALAGVEAPAPRIIDGREDRPPAAVASQHQQRGFTVVVGGVVRMFGIYLANAFLGRHAAGIPEQRLDLLLEEAGVLLL